MFGVLTSYVFLNTVSGGGPVGLRGMESGRNALQHATVGGYSREVVADLHWEPQLTEASLEGLVSLGTHLSLE